MTLLILGLLLWTLVHLLPSAGRGVHTKLALKLGEGGYKGLFSLAILSALALIIVGWRSAQPSFVYVPMEQARSITYVLMLLAVSLFIGSTMQIHLRRALRHPQLLAVLLWSCAHLLSNGDSRSMVLFSGMAVWSVASMYFINRRDGAWSRPTINGWAMDIVWLAASIGIYGGLMWVHPWLAGVSLY
jgi:uncharacterized membrane protein